MSASRAVLTVLAFAALLPSFANAATVTREYDFVGTNIQTVIGTAAPPVLTVNLRFRVTFDPLLQSINAPAGATLIDANVPLGSDFIHSFIPTNMDRMAVGGSANGALGTAVFNDDFTLDFRNALSDTPQFTLFVFTTAATPDSAFRAFAGQITSTAVPAPVTSLLGMAGIAFATAAMRRRARRDIAAQQTLGAAASAG